MTDAQTEARAIETVRDWLNGGCSSWGLPSQQIETLLTAIAAKDAELAVQREAKEHARRLCDCAEARLAEARKALASNASTFEAIRTHIDERSLPLARGLCSQGSFAARRALTGGKADG